MLGKKQIKYFNLYILGNQFSESSRLRFLKNQVVNNSQGLEVPETIRVTIYLSSQGYRIIKTTKKESATYQHVMKKAPGIAAFVSGHQAKVDFLWPSYFQVIYAPISNPSFIFL